MGRVPAVSDLDQAGVATRAQLPALGLAPGLIRQQVRSGRWQVLHVGVYATFSGPVPTMSRVWAALLRAGPGAVAGPRTSLWLAGATDRPPDQLDVTIPEHRRVRGRHPFRVLRRQALASAAHPAARPPRLRIEEAVLDAADETDRAVVVVDLVIAAVQRRLTTAARLRDALARRRGHRWRTLLTEILADVSSGVRNETPRPKQKLVIKSENARE